MNFDSLCIEFLPDILNSLSSNIDTILFIDSNIFNDNLIQNMLNFTQNNTFLLLMNCLFFGILIFYTFNYSLSHLINIYSEQPHVFVFKSVICLACMNSSLWICQNFVYLFSSISEIVCNFGFSILGQELNFSSFFNKIDLYFFSTSQIPSILEIFIIIILLIIFISYIIRYIVCKLLIILSPFAFLTLISEKTSAFFRLWFRQFVLLMFMQIVLPIILLIFFSFDFSSVNTISVCFLIAFLILLLKCQRNLLRNSYISVKRCSSNFQER